MEEWKTYILGDVTTSIQTGPFGSQLHQSDYTDEGTPVVMPKDIINGKIQENGIARVGSFHVKQLERHKLAVGDIIYPRRGDISKCAYITEKEEGWLCGTGCLKVSINETLANAKYIFYVLQQDESIRWIEGNAVGTTMLNLNTSILSGIPISLPPLSVQNRIVEILDSLDEKIALNRRINDNLAS